MSIHLRLLTAALFLSIPVLCVAQEERLSQQNEIQSSATAADAPGVASEQKLAEQVGWELATSDDGVRIERITKNSPAAEAHLEEDDVIVKVGEENIRTADRVSAILQDVLKGGESTVAVVVKREGEELSYLLPLENIRSGRTVGADPVPAGVEGNLAQMIRELQRQNQQQQQLLQSVLAELQSLRLQMSGTSGAAGARAPATTAAPGRTDVSGSVITFPSQTPASAPAPRRPAPSTNP